jgi:tellurite resistance protein
MSVTDQYAADHADANPGSPQAPGTEPQTLPRKIPLNFFGIPFGLLGLADCWLVAAKFNLAPVAIGDVLTALAAVVWATVMIAYGRYVASRRGAFAVDLTDSVASPFASLAVIMPMLAVADGVYPHAHEIGRVVVDVGIAGTVLTGGWFTGQWIYKPLDFKSVHPGYFLPTVAGGFVASASAGLVGQTALAQVLFGLGLISWITLGSIVLGRLQLGPPLPPPLMPTIAIEVAPAGVASFAYFVIHGDHLSGPSAVIAGYGVLMILAQLRLLPGYLKLSFVPSFWAFTFAWAAVVFGAMFWLHAGQPLGWRVYSYLLLTGITILIGAIAAKTVIKLSRGQFIPAAPRQPSARSPEPTCARTAPVTREARS